MVEDPYKVLGISHDASREEIKRAYRKMGKQYHPDLHPDDPEAEKRMVEINEAYDMLTNPEKYEKMRNEAQSGNTYQNPYGSHSQQWQDHRTSYGGGFGDFSFEDLFGFYGSNTWNEKVEIKPEDDDAVRQVINLINIKQFAYAQQKLNDIVSYSRNARWYYLSALTSRGLGNTINAVEAINKAIQMEPDNAAYRRLKQQMQGQAASYRQSGQEAQNYARNMGNICIKFWFLQMFCMCCR